MPDFESAFYNLTLEHLAILRFVDEERYRLKPDGPLDQRLKKIVDFHLLALDEIGQTLGFASPGDFADALMAYVQKERSHAEEHENAGS